MRDHALIENSWVFGPQKKDLARWIKTWWNPKGDYELQLSSKGFFTVIFYNLEDKDHIFEGGPYFYNSAGLYLRFWMDHFFPKRKISYAPGMDSSLLPASRVLVGRNFNGHWQYSGKTC
jgi:hypothetical protein